MVITPTVLSYDPSTLDTISFPFISEAQTTRNHCNLCAPFQRRSRLLHFKDVSPLLRLSWGVSLFPSLSFPKYHCHGLCRPRKAAQAGCASLGRPAGQLPRGELGRLQHDWTMSHPCLDRSTVAGTLERRLGESSKFEEMVDLWASNEDEDIEGLKPQALVRWRDGRDNEIGVDHRPYDWRKWEQDEE